ncbi:MULTISPECIES: hypothetical protein [unclassified Bradyrhizobium]|uniref:hypothetical protein n=1 Tax=unclassified Bradyrhizobium TaxID=2631580 RepID=UPI0029163C70|nr:MULTISPECIES: hypothetical protein [unclassified Bradyrhizobium]
MSTISTLGAPAGALTSNRGGGVASRASNTVLCGGCGSGIGRTDRSVGNTALGGADCWANAGSTSSVVNDSADTANFTICFMITAFK